MGSFADFQTRHDFSMQALCARMLERHRETVQTQKSKIAIAKLVKIMEATLKLANAKGFHATTLRDLAAESGVSMGALYNYLGSKENLMHMILSEVVAGTREVLESPPPDLPTDARSRLAWLIETQIYLSELMQPWFALGYREAKFFPVTDRDLVTDSELTNERRIVHMLIQGCREGEFQVDNPEVTAALIKPLLQDWYVRRSQYRHRGVTPDEFAATVISFIFSAIVSPASRTREHAPAKVSRLRPRPQRA
jgi:AcrR family transcriptional regulator